MNKKVLSEAYGSAEDLKEGFDAFLEEWNALGHPFRWSYNGKGLHLKAVKRFTKMLNQAANKLEITTMTKQLGLMANVFNHYFEEIPEDNWEKLFNVIQFQKETRENNITNEKGPKKKINAENGLNHLLSVIKNYIRPKMLKVA